MIEVKGLHVSIGLINILYDISFKVDQGECVALLGSNGAGKSTTLKTISGLIKAKSGEISFLGKEISNIDAGQRVMEGIIQVPEGGSIFPYLSIKENLFMGAYGNREAWSKKKTVVKKVYELFPILKEREKLAAKSLSGGERQMLAIGRGLMANPKILMIDEPSIGLAPKILLEIYQILKSLHDEGKTILLSEQNVRKALSVANRAYVVENGRIVLEGPSQELLNSDHIRTAYLGM
jgi:branched-chain amino acid transport system ATP-binding protein